MSDVAPVWQRIAPERCVRRLSAERQQWLSLIHAVRGRDTRIMTDLGTNITARPTPIPVAARAYVLGAAMLGHLARGEGDTALNLWNTRGAELNNVSDDLGLQLLHAHAQLAAAGRSRGAASDPVAALLTTGTIH